MESSLAVGVDVGGTTVKAVLATPDGRVLAEAREATPRDPRALVALAVGLWQRWSADQAVPPDLGVVVPGVVDDEAGVVVQAVNLGWRDVPLADWLGWELARIGRPPAVVGHDVRAGLMGERAWGAARGCSSAIFVPIGTGIAAALMIDGHLLRGRGWVGEIGHLAAGGAGAARLVCGCGRQGCLEAYASAAAIARRYEAATQTSVGGADAVVELATHGDPLARRIVAQATEAIGRCLAGLLTIVGPARIVVGGGLAEAGEAILGPIREACLRSAWVPGEIDLVSAQLGDRAGALGAAALAFDRGVS